MAAIQRMTTMTTSLSLFSRGYVHFLTKLTPSTSSTPSSYKVLLTSAAPWKRRSLSRVLSSLSKLEKINSFCTSAVGTVSSDVEEEAKSDDLSSGGGGKIVLPTNDSSERLLRIRHTCAHVMAMAVQKLFPDAKVTIGPWIENGFYYDFDMEPLTDRDLKRIKKEMDRIISRNLPLIREEVSREEAHRRIQALNEPYKLEILESIKEEPITIYHIGDKWWDLCAGPHVDTTGNINAKAVELESVAGAYWRGDVERPMLQRIYGTAWENEEQLKAYIRFKEEAKRRDHRRLGQDLDLFSIQVDLTEDDKSLSSKFVESGQETTKKWTSFIPAA